MYDNLLGEWFTQCSHYFIEFYISDKCFLSSALFFYYLFYCVSNIMLADLSFDTFFTTTAVSPLQKIRVHSLCLRKKGIRRISSLFNKRNALFLQVKNVNSGGVVWPIN